MSSVLFFLFSSLIGLFRRIAGFCKQRYATCGLFPVQHQHSPGGMLRRGGDVAIPAAIEACFHDLQRFFMPARALAQPALSYSQRSGGRWRTPNARRAGVHLPFGFAARYARALPIQSQFTPGIARDFSV